MLHHVIKGHWIYSALRNVFWQFWNNEFSIISIKWIGRYYQKNNYIISYVVYIVISNSCVIQVQKIHKYSTSISTHVLCRNFEHFIFFFSLVIKTNTFSNDFLPKSSNSNLHHKTLTNIIYYITSFSLNREIRNCFNFNCFIIQFFHATFDTFRFLIWFLAIISESSYKNARRISPWFP